MSTIATAPPPTPPSPPARLPFVLVRKGRRAKLAVDPHVAEHFTEPELRAASAWQLLHPEIPPPIPQRGAVVFPDPAIGKINAELERMATARPRVLDDEGAELAELEPDTELGAERKDDALSDDDYESLIDSAADGIDLSSEIQARLEAASLAGRHKPRRDRSSARFMSAIHDYVEPYLAVRNGMSMAVAARTFNIAHIEEHLANVDMWLSLLDQLPKFNRSSFLVRLGRAVEKRRRDAVIGAARAAADKAAFQNKPAEEDSAVKRGAEWATVKHIYIPRSVPRRAPIKDKPWGSSRPVSPAPTPSHLAEAAERAAIERMDAWKSNVRPLGAQAARATAMVRIPPGRKELRCRELECGLAAILESVPYLRADGSVDEDRQLCVDIVDRAVAGMTNPEIAADLGLSVQKVERKLREIKSRAMGCTNYLSSQPIDKGDVGG